MYYDLYLWFYRLVGLAFLYQLVDAALRLSGRVQKLHPLADPKWWRWTAVLGFTLFFGSPNMVGWIFASAYLFFFKILKPKPYGGVTPLHYWEKLKAKFKSFE